MNDIIRMAREAGLFVPQQGIPENGALMRFATLVAAAEREACAELCDELVENRPMTGAGKLIAQECAAAIRARGQK